MPHYRGASAFQGLRWIISNTQDTQFPRQLLCIAIEYPFTPATANVSLPRDLARQLTPLPERASDDSCDYRWIFMSSIVYK